MFVAFGSDFVNERRKSNLYWSCCMTVIAERPGVRCGPKGDIRICEVANTHIFS